MTPIRDDDEDDDEWEDEGSDEEPTIPCPYCRREILEDVPQCPYCERYISEKDHAVATKPIWVIATALVLLGIMIWWAF